jgi:hypothetical protein
MHNYALVLLCPGSKGVLALPPNLITSSPWTVALKHLRNRPVIRDPEVRRPYAAELPELPGNQPQRISCAGIFDVAIGPRGMLPRGTRVGSKSKDWLAGYLRHLPHWFRNATAATLAMELVLVSMAFLTRRWRIICFFLVTVWQVGVIAAANYAVLHHLVLRSQSSCWISRFCDASSHYTGGTVWTNLPRFGIVYESMPKSAIPLSITIIV